jgi:transposase
VADAGKKTREAGGVVVFADEVGFLMNPCVKATWSPVGQTPVVPFRNRNHRKVSALGAIALEVDGRMRTLVDWHPDSYVRGPQAASFVERLLKEFPDRPITLVWDRLQAHRSKTVKAVVELHPRLSIEHLPAYAPDLNPVEGLWCLTKHHRMANHSLDTLDGLLSEARRHVQEVGSEQTMLQACFKIAKLALAPSLPSAQ